mgnify:CR=1 FL=1
MKSASSSAAWANSVIDERSYHVRPELPGGARTIVLHDMVLETAGGAAIELSSLDVRMENCFLAVFHGEAENDNFNGLVLAAGLEWREAAVLRAYASYLRQIRAPFGPRYIAETLIRHPDIARELFELYRARFDPDQLHTAAARTKATEELRQALEIQLAKVLDLVTVMSLTRTRGANHRTRLASWRPLRIPSIEPARSAGHGRRSLSVSTRAARSYAGPPGPASSGMARPAAGHGARRAYPQEHPQPCPENGG